MTARSTHVSAKANKIYRTQPAASFPASARALGKTSHLYVRQRQQTLTEMLSVPKFTYGQKQTSAASDYYGQQTLKTYTIPSPAFGSSNCPLGGIFGVTRDIAPSVHGGKRSGASREHPFAFYNPM